MSGQSSVSPKPKATRQFLVHLDAELIRRVKITAIDRNVTASKLVQEALITFLFARPVATATNLPGDMP